MTNRRRCREIRKHIHNNDKQGISKMTRHAFVDCVNKCVIERNCQEAYPTEYPTEQYSAESPNEESDNGNQPKRKVLPKAVRL